MHLYNYNLMKRKKGGESRSKGFQHRIIQTVQRVFSGSEPAHPETLIFGKPAQQTARTTRKRGVRLQKDFVEDEDLIVVLEVLSKRSEKIQVLRPKSIATKKVKTLKPEMKGMMKKIITNMVRNISMKRNPLFSVMESRSNRC